MERRSKSASLFKDAKYKGQSEKLVKRALYCRMCISHAINIKNYSLKALNENGGVMQVAIVCPPPIINRPGYVNTPRDTFTPMSTLELENIRKPIKIRAKRVKGKGANGKAAKSMGKKKPRLIDSVFSSIFTGEHDIFEDHIYDDDSPIATCDLFDFEPSFPVAPEEHPRKRYGYWSLENNMNMTVDLNDIELFARDELTD